MMAFKGSERKWRRFSASLRCRFVWNVFASLCLVTLILVSTSLQGVECRKDKKFGSNTRYNVIREQRQRLKEKLMETTTRRSKDEKANGSEPSEMSTSNQEEGEKVEEAFHLAKQESLQDYKTWSSCNVTGPCVRCSKEEEQKDPTSCRKTKYRHEITCIDPGEAGPEEDSPRTARETFVMFESCKVANKPLSIGWFIGIMAMILTCSSPVVAVRKRRRGR